MNPEIIGLLAGSLTTLSFLPQIIHVFKTRSTKDISLGMYLLFCAGVILWIAYSYLIDSISIFITNTITLLFSGSVLVMKLIFKR